MKQFNYIIKNEYGLHARPAGILSKKANVYKSRIVVYRGEKSAELTRLIAVMSLGVKKGDKVTITVEGTDEETAVKEIEQFFKDNF